ncbi:hypothetical protein AB0I28_28565 [Phytomonospora sp. NPDC050363]|uniref:hypothetical protein n=1 Tax=Phytomonospora sp. NPDC050363 TaxID=3155642 RepID=UPI0033DFAB0E
MNPISPATGTRDDEIAHYIAAVEDSLSDLPPHIRGELIGDLVDHLTEIAGETTTAVPLAARLGPPEGYAAELRATLPARTAVPMPHPLPHQGFAPARTASMDWADAVDRADLALGGFAGYPRFSELCRALRPGWWALRGALLVQFPLSYFLLGGGGHVVLYSSIALLPLGLLYAAGALASIRLGRMRGPNAASINVLAGIAALGGVLVLVGSRFSYLF